MFVFIVVRFVHSILYKLYSIARYQSCVARGSVERYSCSGH